MPFSTQFANDCLKLILAGTPITGLADNAAATPLETLWVAFHTADPGAAGVQNTTELGYGEYARQPVLRIADSWVFSGNIAKPAAAIEFPEMLTGAGGTITHISIGTASVGTGKILTRGPFIPNLVITAGTTPRAKAGTEIVFEA